MEIIVKDLNTMDEISIRTQHSEYRFCVTDPILCRGFLSGGVFGKTEHEAILTGAIIPEELPPHISAKLQIGGCALFYVAANENLKRLKTSVITELAMTDVPSANAPADC